MIPNERNCVACGRPRPAKEEFCPYCTAPPPLSPERGLPPGAVVQTGLETRWGGSIANPTAEELRAALAELDTPDEEHPDTWLSDVDGWTLVAYESGRLCLMDTDGSVLHERGGASRQDCLELWLLLQQGRRDEIEKRLSV